MKTPNTNEMGMYASEFSESNFFDKLTRVMRAAGEKVIYMALLLYYTMLSSQVSIKDKALIVCALGYFICPADLIPDILPIIGFTDDMAAFGIAYQTVKDNITPEIEERAKTAACRLTK